MDVFINLKSEYSPVFSTYLHELKKKVHHFLFQVDKQRSIVNFAQKEHFQEIMI